MSFHQKSGCDSYDFVYLPLLAAASCEVTDQTVKSVLIGLERERQVLMKSQSNADFRTGHKTHTGPRHVQYFFSH